MIRPRRRRGLCSSAAPSIVTPMTSLRGPLCAAWISLAACSSHQGTPPRTAPAAPIAGPDAAPRQTPSNAPEPAAPAPADRFIVPEASASRFYVGHYDPATAYFTPDEQDVAAFERALPAFLAGSSDADARAIAGELTKYRRQFLGVVRDEGRLVFGNYFCDQGESAANPVMVDDGGRCYFNVFYDPRRQAFLRLTINGSG
jgi:hypothetical protein